MRGNKENSDSLKEVIENDKEVDLHIKVEINEDTWIETIDKASGKKYYYNAITKVTQWDRPRTKNIFLRTDETLHNNE